VQNRN